MRFETVPFPGDAGKHTDRDHRECAGRKFKVNSRGVGGIYINYVECLSCRLELAAFENGLVKPQRTTFAEIVRQSA